MKCVICGFEWSEGAGNHDCYEQKDMRIAELELAIRRISIATLVGAEQVDIAIAAAAALIEEKADE